jgi:heme/copper-type cytochrome/quinol oxidase subunit 2
MLIYRIEEENKSGPFGLISDCIVDHPTPSEVFACLRKRLFLNPDTHLDPKRLAQAEKIKATVVANHAANDKGWNFAWKTKTKAANYIKSAECVEYATDFGFKISVYEVDKGNYLVLPDGQVRFSITDAELICRLDISEFRKKYQKTIDYFKF